MKCPPPSNCWPFLGMAIGNPKNHKDGGHPPHPVPVQVDVLFLIFFLFTLIRSVAKFCEVPAWVGHQLLGWGPPLLPYNLARGPVQQAASHHTRRSADQAGGLSCLTLYAQEPQADVCDGRARGGRGRADAGAPDGHGQPWRGRV